MTYIFTLLCIFLFGYLLNMFYISVLYHRALCHNSLKLSRFAMFLVRHTGNWVTGMDPKAWSCMHRLHHTHSDTEMDPHSPTRFGLFGVAYAQYSSYKRIMSRLVLQQQKFCKVVEDIPFDINWLNKGKLWFLPYLVHFTIGIIIGLSSSSILFGVAYFAGISSHPIQGWLVNAFAHKYGYRNYETEDDSTNNVLIALLTCGEGYQNNHHASPESANFARKFYEIDFGYLMAKVAVLFGFLKRA